MLSRAFAFVDNIDAELGARVEQQYRDMRPGLSKTTGQTPTKSKSVAAAT